MGHMVLASTERLIERTAPSAGDLVKERVILESVPHTEGATGAAPDRDKESVDLGELQTRATCH